MSFIDDIKAKVDPVNFYRKELQGSVGKKSTKGWFAWNGLCPFHADNNPGSFYINLTTGAFKCFACQVKGGDIIAFHQMKHQTTFATTIKEIEHEWMN